MIEFNSKGSFQNIENMLGRQTKSAIVSKLEKYGREGVEALRRVTPTKTGEAADSWYYEVLVEGKVYSIIWGNNKIVAGQPVVILLQHGHATRNGGWVEGYDFINPALRPIFDRIADEVWKEVSK